MKIAVCCKITPDPDMISVDDGGNVSFARAQWKTSEYDKQAIQAAVDLAGEGDEVVIITAGEDEVTVAKHHKDVLARGGDRMLAVSESGIRDADTATVAGILAAAIKRENPDIVLFGEGSSDRYCQMTGLYVAEILGMPSANFVCSIAVDGTTVTIKRDLEDGIQTVEMSLPCALSVAASLNTPSLPSMKQILAAGKKPVEIVSASDLGVSVEAKLQQTAVAAPPLPDRRCIPLSGEAAEVAAQLIDYLRKDNVLN